MQIIEARCSVRRCKHLFDHMRKRKIDGPPGYVHVHLCKAFPDGRGIPTVIAFGDEDHTKPYPGDGGVQYEQRK